MVRYLYFIVICSLLRLRNLICYGLLYHEPYFGLFGGVVLFTFTFFLAFTFPFCVLWKVCWIGVIFTTMLFTPAASPLPYFGCSGVCVPVYFYFLLFFTFFCNFDFSSGHVCRNGTVFYPLILWKEASDDVRCHRIAQKRWYCLYSPFCTQPRIKMRNDSHFTNRVSKEIPVIFLNHIRSWARP